MSHRDDISLADRIRVRWVLVCIATTAVVAIGLVGFGLVQALSRPAKRLSGPATKYSSSAPLLATYESVRSQVTPETAPQAILETPPLAAVEPKIHEVAAGESLGTIAVAEHLPNWRSLWEANPEVTNPDILRVGQKLKIPTATSVAIQPKP